MTQTLKIKRINILLAQPENNVLQKMVQLVERKRAKTKQQVSNTNKRHPKSVAPLY